MSDRRAFMPRSALLYAAAVTLVATYFLGDQLGKFSDDWFIGQRDVATGEIARWTLNDLDRMYWRPLHCIFTAGMQTLLWNHDWAIHLILTASHLVVAILLARLMLEIGFGWRTSAATATCFLVYPISHEAFFWASAWMYPWAAAVCIAIMMLQVRFQRRQTREPGLGRLMLAFVLGHALACCLEQPLLVIPALPLLGLAVAPRDQEMRVRWSRAILPGFVAALGALLYVVLMYRTLSVGDRGSPETLTPLDQVPARILKIAETAWKWMAHVGFVRAAFQTGLAVLVEHPIRAAFAVATLFGAGALLRRVWMDEPGPMHPASKATFRPALLAAFGGAVVVANWVPIVLIFTYGGASRLCYLPSLGVALAAGALIHGARRRVPSVPALRRGFAALMLVSSVGTVCLIGVQELYRRCWNMDRDIAAQLQALFPDTAPGAIFVPAEIRWPIASTGSRRFNNSLAISLDNPWNAPSLVRRAFKQPKITSTHAGYWGEPKWVGAGSDGLRWAGTLVGSLKRDEAGIGLIPWKRAVVIAIDERGKVVPMGRVRLRRPDGSELVINLPRMRNVDGAELEWVFPGEFDPVPWKPAPR